MKAFPTIDMAEVTRLTREGRLDEAMRLLRGERDADALTKQSSSDESSQSGAGADATPSIIDMQPPSAANGGAWTAPPVRESSTATPASPPPAPASTQRATLDRVLKPRMRVGASAMSPSVELPSGARWEERSYANAGDSRDYRLYVPAAYDGTPMPLLVMLHGCTQTPDDFARGTRMNELAEEQGFLVAYPAQSQTANASKCWNWFNADDQQRDRGEPALIAGITREILRDFAIDPRRVYVAGLSAGGAMAAILGATYPDLYAAIGVHSGLARGAASDIPSAFAAMRNGGVPATRSNAHSTPTIIFHGDADTTVNPLNAEQVALDAKGGAHTTRQTKAGSSVGGVAYSVGVETADDGRIVLEQWTLHGAGHAWSGGSPNGSFVEPRGPDASREMLRFFNGHANASARS